MSTIDEKENVKQEELEMTPLGSVGAEKEKGNGVDSSGDLDAEESAEEKDEQKEAIEALRKYTDEDDDESLGEISIKSILGGDFLQSKFIMKQVGFVMFCVLLMIFYTGNRYDSQQDAILIDSLRGRLQEVKYNVLTQSSDLLNKTRQSNIEKALASTKDSVLKNPITPPFLIKLTDDDSSSKPVIHEVLVGDEETEESEEMKRMDEEQKAAKEQKKQKGDKKQESKTEGQSAETTQKQEKAEDEVKKEDAADANKQDAQQ